ncbi:MAG: ABC transporter substrate-binding protein [Treponema sp.]|jgi:peptide/nickel transport system substrate-binding protein|nr:ABC transporter substrate-binding protein [Treponema sp.]
MNRLKTPGVLFAFAAVIIAFFPSCGAKNIQTVKTAAELRYGFTTEPSTLDPLNPANTADGRSILFNVFEGLVKPDTAGELQPCIAESWTIEQGGLVYNFTLRQDLRFHDDSVLTAADVKFSLETAASAAFDGLVKIEKITADDNNHVTITLKSPDPEFLPYMTIGIVKAGNTDREKSVIGTGPFFIESYTAQQNLILRKFNGYRQQPLQPLPYLEKVTILFFADSDALMLALRGGGIDGAFITGSLVSQLNRKEFDVFHGYSASVQLLALNNAAPLDDVRVRRAINYAVDVQGIIDTAFFGRGEPSGSPVIPGLSVSYEKSLEYPIDPEQARSLLAQAGYGEGRRLALEITVPSNYTMHVDTAQVIADQLSKAGIDVSIKLVDWAGWLSGVYRNRQYQATVISLDSPSVSARSFLSRYHSKDGSNFINFSNAEFDSVYESALIETDDEKRVELYREAQRIIASNAASVYLQDIFYFKVFRGGAFGGVLNYPLYVIDFASIYGIEKN